MKLSKEQVPLFVGIGIPAFLIIFILASEYLPTLLIKPKYNFIYTKGCGYDQNYVTVRNGRISVNLQTTDNRNMRMYMLNISDCFYLYDVSTDSSRRMSLPEAQAYTLNPTDKSPDGFQVTEKTSDNGGSDFFFFWYGGGYQDAYYLIGHGYNRKVADKNTDYSNNDFQFLGWIQQ